MLEEVRIEDSDWVKGKGRRTAERMEMGLVVRRGKGEGKSERELYILHSHHSADKPIAHSPMTIARYLAMTTILLERMNA